MLTYEFAHPKEKIVVWKDFTELMKMAFERK